MKIFVNNKAVEVTDNCTIGQVIQTQGLSHSNIAVALNNKLVVRNVWEETFVNENDKIIIIAAAYGG